jgi:hypothetical protein
MYLVACHSDASLYSLTNSPEWLLGGLWYFQQNQIVIGKEKASFILRMGEEYYDNPKK